jgi:hypothetical protein
MLVSYAEGRVFGIHDIGGGSEDGLSKSRCGHILAYAQIPSQCNDVFAIGKLLLKVYSGLQQAGNSTHLAVEEGKLGKEVRLG